MDQNMLLQEISNLTALLNQEKAKLLEENQRACQLWQDLEETKAQLKKQKKLKKIWIKKEKKSKQQYERLQKYADAETLSSAKIASLVQNSIIHKKKKLLQKDYELLKVAHITSVENLSSELQTEKARNSDLQNQLREVMLSYEALSRTNEEQQAMKIQLNQAGAEKMQHEFEVLGKTHQEKEINLKKGLDNMKTPFSQQIEREIDFICFKWNSEFKMDELNEEVQVRLESETKYQEQTLILKAGKVAIHQKMVEEISVLQNSYSQPEKNVTAELQQVKIQLENQKVINYQLPEQLREKGELRAQK